MSELILFTKWLTCKRSTLSCVAAKPDGRWRWGCGGTETSQLWFQTRHSVTSNNAQIYGGEVMREVSCLSKRTPLDRRPVMKSHLEKRVVRSECTTTANLSSPRHLICLPLACGGAEKSLMAATVSRYGFQTAKKLIVFPPTVSVPVKVGSCVLLKKIPPSVQLGRLDCYFACINFWLPSA